MLSGFVEALYGFTELGSVRVPKESHRGVIGVSIGICKFLQAATGFLNPEQRNHRTPHRPHRGAPEGGLTDHLKEPLKAIPEEGLEGTLKDPLKGTLLKEKTRIRNRSS